MANSPSSLSSRRNKAGCMAGIAHLFDFNPGVAGRKLLTDRKYRAGTDASNDERTKIGGGGNLHDRKSSSASKRATEVPIKSLIAEEISKEPESKNRTPSVVARLMGLDALPSDSKNKLTNEGTEQAAQQSPSHLQIVKSSSHRSPGTVNDPIPTIAHTLSDLSLYGRSNEEGRTLGPDSFPCKASSHIHNVMQEHEARKMWEQENVGKTETLDNLDSQMTAKPMLVKKKTSEAKLEYSQRHKSLHKQQYGYREFADDKDHLASKNSSARFLEEPESLYGRRIQNTRDSADASKQFKKHAKTQLQTNRITQETDFWVERGLSGSSPLSSVPTETCQRYPSWNNESTNMKRNQQQPTRIVVLKPNFSRVNKLKSSDEKSPRSPRDFLEAMEIIKENSMGVLHDLRQRLEQDNDFRDISRNCKLPNDAKEIAREIARQVRESVARDLMVNRVNAGTEVHHPSGMNQKCFFPNTAVDTRRFSHLKDKYIENFGQQPHISSNSGRHSVDGTDMRWNRRSASTNVTIDSDSSSYSVCDSETDSEGQLDDEMYRALLRSRSVPTGSFYLHGEEIEYPRMPVVNDSMAGMTKVVANKLKDGSIPQAVPARRSSFGRKGMGSKYSFSKIRKDKIESKHVAANLVTREPISRIGSVDVEKNQCQIDDTGPIPDSDSSTSSLENILSTDATFIPEGSVRREECAEQDSGRLLSTVESSLSENLTVTIESIEDSEASVHSPLTSPRRTMNLANDGSIGNHSKISKSIFEQPSPVSVLESVFQEESPNTMEFAEISSELQELKSRLQLLKLLDQETSSSNSEFCHDDSVYTDEDKYTASHYPDVSKEDHQMEYLEFLIDGIQFQNGNEQELLYVRDLLVASGFIGDNGSILTRWHAPNQPLASFMFERMEDSYSNTGKPTCRGTVLTYDERHLLFDRVNEVLVEVLGPEINNRRWWKGLAAPTIPIPSGKVLLQCVWDAVCQGCCSRSESQDSLVTLVSRDLSGKDRWQEIDAEFELVVLEVERAIFNDLMLETAILF